MNFETVVVVLQALLVAVVPLRRSFCETSAGSNCLRYPRLFELCGQRIIPPQNHSASIFKSLATNFDNKVA